MDNLDHVVYVRLGGRDYSHIKEASLKQGCSASAYIRHAAKAYMVVEEGSGTHPDVVAVDRATLAGLRFELVRQGINLNQVAHSMNVARLAAENRPMSPRDVSALLQGVEDAEAELPVISSRLTEISSSVERVARAAIVEAPPPRRRPSPPADGGEG